MEVVKTIIAQMGGFGKLKAMVNGRDYVGGENSVMFRFSGSRKANKCRVTLDWSDTYTFELFKISGRGLNYKTVIKLENVYDDMLIPLFTEYTGLDLTL